MSGKCVLVVDDDLQLQEFLKEVLEQHGYQVKLASDGNEGVAQFKYWRPDLVLTDMVMPNSEGLELVDYVRERAPGTPIITMSGGHRESKNTLEMSHYLGANLSLEKPFSITTLMQAVETLLKK